MGTYLWSALMHIKKARHITMSCSINKFWDVIIYDFTLV